MSATLAPAAAIARDLRALLKNSQVVDGPAELQTFAYDASFMTQRDKLANNSCRPACGFAHSETSVDARSQAVNLPLPISLTDGE